MKKRLMAAVLSTAMAATMLLTGSISVQAADAAAANDPAVELIFTSVSVSGDSHTEAMYEFADKVEELSGGSVTCKCYDNGSLFSSENEFDALLNGDADLAYILSRQLQHRFRPTACLLPDICSAPMSI